MYPQITHISQAHQSEHFTRTFIRQLSGVCSCSGNGARISPTTYGGTTLTFDPENRMTAFGNVLTAGYSGNGLRAWKQTSGGRTYFLYDGVVPVVELDNTSAITATNTFGAAGLISRRIGSTSVFYVFDTEGSVSQRTDSSGNTLSYLFNAFEERLSGSQADPFGYRARFGYYTDNETGLQLLTHRYYDPSSGRFLARDPVGYSGGLNLYSYVANNPINSVDPLGLTRLIFYIDTGILVVIPNEGVPYWFKATSGSGDAMNNPSRTGEKLIGPIPPGNYFIDMKDFSDPGFIGEWGRFSFSGGDWGDFRVPIKPQPWNKAKGRDGFYLHGGWKLGSAGCIDIGGGVNGNAATDQMGTKWSYL